MYKYSHIYPLITTLCHQEMRKVPIYRHIYRLITTLCHQEMRKVQEQSYLAKLKSYLECNTCFYGDSPKILPFLLGFFVLFSVVLLLFFLLFCCCCCCCCCCFCCCCFFHRKQLSILQFLRKNLGYQKGKEFTMRGWKFFHLRVLPVGKKVHSFILGSYFSEWTNRWIKLYFFK